MPKIVFEDKLDPIKCSEVEQHLAVYYTSEPQVIFREGQQMTFYSTSYLPRTVIDHSIFISKDDKNRIRPNSLFRIINDSNKSIYSKCRITHMQDENNLIKICFTSQHISLRANFRRQETILFDTSNVPEVDHINCRCHSHESYDFQYSEV